MGRAPEPVTALGGSRKRPGSTSTSDRAGSEAQAHIPFFSVLCPKIRGSVLTGTVTPVTCSWDLPGRAL